MKQNWTCSESSASFSVGTASNKKLTRAIEKARKSKAADKNQGFCFFNFFSWGRTFQNVRLIKWRQRTTSSDPVCRPPLFIREAVIGKRRGAGPPRVTFGCFSLFFSRYLLGKASEVLLKIEASFRVRNGTLPRYFYGDLLI